MRSDLPEVEPPDTIKRTVRLEKGDEAMCALKLKIANVRVHRPEVF